MKTTIEVDSLKELDDVAEKFLEMTSGICVFCFHGEMGVGKTTFIKSFCRKMGVKDEVQSPTFSIVNEYETLKNEPVFHFDFYRLKSEEEAYDLGYEQYLYSGYFCFIEWPEKVKSLLNLKKADIFIELIAGKRQIRLEYD